MGYYANYNGAIKLKENPPQAILDSFEDYFENFDYYEDSICFGGYGKYYEDTVTDLLEEIIPYVSDGTIEYAGEDGGHWRFAFVDGKWEEQDGEIVYSSNPINNKVKENMRAEFIGEIIDIFDDEIDPDNPVFTGEKYDRVCVKLFGLMKGWRVF